MRRILAGAAVALMLASCITIQMPPPAPTTGGSSGGTVSSAPSSSTPISGPNGRRLVEEMIGLVNAHRRAARCPELVWMQAVANAAQGHSDDMVRRRFFDHRSPEGLGPSDRLRAQGVSYRALGENIAQHPGTARDVLNGWLASPGHRQNLDRCTYTHHGIGLRDGHWTHLFVTPMPAPSSGQ